MESDWKKFRQLVPVLRDRYLAKRIALFARMLADPAKTEAGRFWDTLNEMEHEAKTLQRCLDGHSRSRMWMAMVLMREAGMLTREDAAEFSAELQSRLFPDPG